MPTGDAHRMNGVRIAGTSATLNSCAQRRAGLARGADTRGNSPASGLASASRPPNSNRNDQPRASIGPVWSRPNTSFSQSRASARLVGL